MFYICNRLREGCHILSATTGRLKDMLEKHQISLTKVKYFVLDQADQMFGKSFELDICKLETLGLPSKHERFTFMFSATFSDEIRILAQHFIRDNYISLVVGKLDAANEDIIQTIEKVPNTFKKDRLFQLLEQNLKSERCLIFVETTRTADYISIQQFTNGICQILVATSVVARGLDFPLVDYVINYDLPNSIDIYIHRIGRTGRAGHLGRSISFFDPDRNSDRKTARDLISKLSEVVGQVVPEFLKRYVDDPYYIFSCDGYGVRNINITHFKANGFGNQN
ncbi:unnamed protein product [Rotaria sp. Silwood1]|nr:unnamed protein product [Rotaria sp. Silwood1]CAF1667546.1 unnamed protein product [Rotaria sp. Silwood1]